MKKEMVKEAKEKIKKYGKMKDLVVVRNKELEVQEHLLNIEEDDLCKKRIAKSIEKLKVDIQELEKDIIAIEKGLSHLDSISSKIIDMKYFKNEKWIAVQLESGYGDTRCREIGREAIIIIAEFLYHQELSFA